MHSHRRGPGGPEDHIEQIVRRAIRRRFRPGMAAAAFAMHQGAGGDHHQMFRGRRVVGDGDLRLIALSLIAESPRHGYDIIKALEERSRGAYSPSPGVVYPTLTFLEEAGFATSASEGNKRVYAVTEAGRAHLAENHDQVRVALAEIERFGRRVEGLRDWFDVADIDIEVAEGEPAEGDPEDYRERPGRGEKGDAFRELRNARRDLKLAIAALLRAGPASVAHGVEILRKAAEDIRKAGEEIKDRK
jgi:DNA-binding PadR family transcriptional regulator